MLLEAASVKASHAKVCIDVQMTPHHGTARTATVQTSWDGTDGHCADIRTGGHKLRGGRQPPRAEMTMTVEPTAQSKRKTSGWGSWRCLQWSSSRLTVFNLWSNWVVTAALSDMAYMAAGKSGAGLINALGLPMVSTTAACCTQLAECAPTRLVAFEALRQWAGSGGVCSLADFAVQEVR